MKTTNHQQIIQLLKRTGSVGISGYDLTYKYGIKQAPTRIFELKEKGYLIQTKPFGKTVMYYLVGEVNRQTSNRATKPAYQPEKILEPWEKPCISYEKEGRIYWKYFENEQEKQEYLSPKQLSL